MTENTFVGRKTPGDGKVEVSEAFARALGGSGSDVQLWLDGHLATANVTELPCTCAKAALAGAHVHHFIESAAFRDLAVGAALELRGDVGCLDVVVGPG